jgi:Tol biopolymer transport system component
MTTSPKRAEWPDAPARDSKSQVTRSFTVLLAAFGLTMFLVATAGFARPTHSPEIGAQRLVGKFAYATHKGDIWIVNADGSDNRQVTRSGAGFDFKPSWSADGKQIAFQSTRGVRPPSVETNILVINVDGSGERQLTTPSRFRYGGSSPDWSPDGKRIAFGSALGLALIRPSGGPVRLVGVPGDAPSWSPDSSKIAYVAPTGSGQPPNQDVYIVSPSGSRPRRLTKEPGLDFTGAWSPDGKRVAYFVQERGSGHTMIADSDGSHAAQITRAVGTQFPSDWIIHGRLVVGISKPRERTPTWYLMRPDGSQLRLLPQLKAAIVVAWHR